MLDPFIRQVSIMGVVWNLTTIHFKFKSVPKQTDLVNNFPLQMSS